LDALIDRLRERAADPERQVDARDSQFYSQVKSLDLGGLVGMLGELRPLFGRALDLSRSGSVDPDVLPKAEEFSTGMSTPVDVVLPKPAALQDLERLEASLGVAFPAQLRRVYLEVANGGFGPGHGLLAVDRVAAEYKHLREWILGTGHPWPDGLLPVVHRDPGWDCVEASTGRVVEFDPEELDEDVGAAQFSRAFRELAPSVETWLEAWVVSPSPAEREAALWADAEASSVQTARAARATIARMAPEERAAMGLPEVGWESVVWGGIGLEEPDSASEDT
jgi:hypothetical protein